MRINRLLLPKHMGRPTRTHDGMVITLTSNMRWCSDVFQILCFNGEKIRVAFAMDTCTTGGVTSEMVKDLMVSSVSRETILFASMIGFEVCTTPYYTHESNGMAEAFIKTFKRDYVSVHDLSDAKTVMALLPLWFEDYNNYHPHKGLKMRSPREFMMMQNKLEGCPV